ncbi:RNA recognition motif domain-containing protein [Ditylenchus destructor]|uniref:RNA recognition motif domain-containing protein n=1 Tax=Ditylenchus destructor TaxID=166010 RepID=A0AAD4MRI7_9BILA|nr:RNA recognition motif domain-containing protein [Ditylenchus destructor]
MALQQIPQSGSEMNQGLVSYGTLDECLPFTSMLNLRIAFQKCVRRASILGNSPLRHHTSRSSNVIHISRLSYSNGNIEEAEGSSISAQKDRKKLKISSSNAIHISRLSYSNDNSEEAEGASMSYRYIKDREKQADAIKSPQAIANDPQANEILSSSEKKPPPAIANDPEVNSTPPAIEDEKAQNSKNLNFRRYHICVRGFSKAMPGIRQCQPFVLEKFYSQFGKLIQCVLYKNKHRVPKARVVFESKKAMDRALESSPHRINQEQVTAEIGTYQNQFNDLRVFDLSHETTEESLRAFYSRFGNLIYCGVNKGSEIGKSNGRGYVTFASHEELDRALDAQPHVIDGSEVFLRYSTGELDLMIMEVPEGITEESLRTFFSQYGRVRRCEWLKGKNRIVHAFLTFSTVDEVNRAMADRPHIIDNNILKTDYPIKQGLFSIFVGSLPENTTPESLFKAFSKFGKIVYLEVLNGNGRRISGKNQRGRYGSVSYGTRQEADKAVDANPHEIDGVIVNVRKATDKPVDKSRVVSNRK